MVLQVVNDLLHFIKTGPQEPRKFLQHITKDTKNWCPFVHNPTRTTDLDCYAQFGGVKLLAKFLDKYYQVFEYLEIDPSELETLRKSILRIKTPGNNPTHFMFRSNLDATIELIKDYEKMVYQKNSLLTCEECIRLDEALRCIDNLCTFSCVVMAVSAVEARLHFLIKDASPQIYKTEFEKATLGRLISLFSDDEYKAKRYSKIKKILPNEHKPLIDLLNHYRVLSAHPKSKRISHAIVKSMLNLSFAFLLDDNLKLEAKYRLHSNKGPESSPIPNPTPNPSGGQVPSRIQHLASSASGPTVQPSPKNP